LELCNKSISQGIVPIGYLCDDKWIFCPENVNDINLEGGCTVKYLARDIEGLSEDNQKLLIIGSDKYRLDLIIKDYKSDSRFIKSQITVMGKNKVSLANSFVLGSDITDENMYMSAKLDINSFDNILILGSTIDEKSDDNNYFAYSLVRGLNVNAQIVVEIVDSNLRTLLESKYEDRNNQFTDISQAGQLVQELQDEGAISFIEDVSNDTTSVDVHEIILSKDYYWLDVLEKMTEGIYPVGYKIQNEDWLFEPENVKFKLPKNTIVKYMARKEVEL
jgi:hypothetical protein